MTIHDGLMSRPRTIPDETIFSIVLDLLAEGGDKAVAFSSVSHASRLAAPTLAQRFGTRDGMVRAALLAGWKSAMAATERAEAEAALSPKGAVKVLKSLGELPDLPLLARELRDPRVREQAEQWRNRVETALVLRLGAGAKARNAAAMMFAAWQGQILWQAAGGKGFRLKDAAARIV
jgi:hypothetical protein